MKIKTITKTLLTAAILSSGLVSAQNSSALVHEAKATTISSTKSIVDTAILNGNSNLKLLVTHNLNPNGASGLYVNKVLGFRFQSFKWYITHQDNSSFTPNTFYNVFVPGDDAYTWSHNTDSANTISNYTEINDGRINNNPNAKVFIANNLANYNNKVNGVFYRTSTKRWCIFNQNTGDSFEENLEFNIVVAKPNNGFSTMLHTADGTNTSNHFTYLNDPELNNNPDAIIFLTQVWNPGGTQSGVYNDHNVGVEYNTNNNKWRIINEDLANIPLGASFNVMFFKNNSIGIDEKPLTSNNVNIFPNPATNSQTVAIELNSEINGVVNLSLLSITGQEVLNESFYKASDVYKHLIQLNGAVPGIYLVRIENNNRVGVQKLIVR